MPHERFLVLPGSWGLMLAEKLELGVMKAIEFKPNAV
jgi:hypothetical protein